MIQNCWGNIVAGLLVMWNCWGNMFMALKRIVEHREGGGGIMI